MHMSGGWSELKTMLSRDCQLVSHSMWVGILTSWQLDTEREHSKRAWGEQLNEENPGRNCMAFPD